MSSMNFINSFKCLVARCCSNERKATQSVYIKGEKPTLLTLVTQFKIALLSLMLDKHNVPKLVDNYKKSMKDQLFEQRWKQHQFLTLYLDLTISYKTHYQIT